MSRVSRVSGSIVDRSTSNRGFSNSPSYSSMKAWQPLTCDAEDRGTLRSHANERLVSTTAAAAAAAYHLRRNELKPLHVRLIAHVVQKPSDRYFLVLHLALRNNTRRRGQTCHERGSRVTSEADSANRPVRGPTFFFKSVITWSTIARQDSHNSMSSTSTGARGSSPMMGESALHRPLSQTQHIAMCRCSSSRRLPAAPAVKHSGRNERTKGAHNAKHRKHRSHHAHHPVFLLCQHAQPPARRATERESATPACTVGNIRGLRPRRARTARERWACAPAAWSPARIQQAALSRNRRDRINS